MKEDPILKVSFIKMHWFDDWTTGQNDVILACLGQRTYLVLLLILESHFKTDYSTG